MPPPQAEQAGRVALQDEPAIPRGADRDIRCRHSALNELCPLHFFELVTPVTFDLASQHGLDFLVPE